MFDKASALSEDRRDMPLISFEGSEGCGKSTQVALLAASLEDAGLRAMVLREPGGTAIGESIRHLLQHDEKNFAMTPETELLLFEASRSQLVREKIAPALARRGIVICDRYFDSTTVYQGAARRLDFTMVETLNRFAVGPYIPALTILLDIDRTTARSRMSARWLRDRMEEQPDEFYQRVTDAYRALAKSEKDRVILFDGGRPVEEIAREIRETVWQRLCLPPIQNPAGENKRA